METGILFQESGNRNPTPFRKPFHPPQILQRPRKPIEDQNVHHPLNNYADENRQIEEDDDDNIKMIVGSAEDTCLTIGEYEGQMMLNVFPDTEDGEALAQSSSKQPESKIKKYNLRPRPTIQKS